MRVSRVVTVVLLLLAGACTAAFATDIFVATNGNDANPGTITQPKATLRAAAGIAQPGDNIQVRAGLYNQHLYWDLGANGTPGAYISVQAYDGDLTVQLVGENKSDTICFHGKQYCKLIGFDITGGGGTAPVHSDNNGTVRPSHIYVQRCYVHDPPRGEDCTHMNGEYIFTENCEACRPNDHVLDYVNVDYGAVRNCYLHDFDDNATYAKGGSDSCVFENNVISNQGTGSDNPAVGFGQQTTGVEQTDTHQSYNCVFRNNIIRNCPNGAVGTYDCYHGYFYNNTIYNCGGYNGRGIVHLRTSTDWGGAATDDGVYIFNNVFLDTAGDMGSVYVKQSSHVVNDFASGNNNYYNNGNPIPSTGYVDPNLEAGATFGNPNLANPNGSATTWQGWVDCYRITAASTALIDHGASSAGNTPFPAVINDIDGSTRPQGAGYDIGAFEYGGGAPAPPVANFTGVPTSGAAPLTVAFTDTSSGNPTSWSWTFGDGGSSTAQSPSHVYGSANSYTVSLTATNGQGSDGETKTNYITVAQVQDYTCASLTVNNGTIASGDHTSVHTSDNVYLVITAAKSGNKYTAQVSYTYNTGLSSLSSLVVTTEGKVSTGTQPLTVYAYNYSTSTWTSIATGTLTTTDSTVTPSVSNPSQYISGGTVQVRVKVGGTSNTAFSNSTDLVKITAAP